MTSTDDRHTIAFIGLGAMGRPMVANLATNLVPRCTGVAIRVYDIADGPGQELQELFPHVVQKTDSIRAAVSDAVRLASLLLHKTVVFTMLPESAHVRSVYLDPHGGIISTLGQDSAKILVDCSTIDTATSLHVKSEVARIAPRSFFYDCPVSGGVLGAAQGTIAFFMGCSSSDPNLPRLHELLDCMGSKAIPCGGPSLGLAAKLSNNYLSGIITIAASEAMDMGMRAGIDPATLASVFASGTAQNRQCDVFNPVPNVCPQAPSSKGYRGGFRVELMKKDMGLAVDMARRIGAKNVLGVSGLGVYAAASAAEDCKGLDSRVVYRYLGGKESFNSVDGARAEPVKEI
ncbi:putative 3-hydroxyisobutyrate dehydrogenase [Triangularia verruculosa]|uniref:3-hydroxyisobutyrate dehydrogenase n=1 Tax=Triangularia verruculosa TaxID=2587418 RepID=A0AAN6XCA9_9PEZI|nr:putative 3-hydroxyisobutyrate dehydrogenase [Triangularia verruculosa]